MNRTHTNGQLRIEQVGQIVELKGWVAKKRNLGGLIFIDLRDKTGITQIVCNPEDECYQVASELKNEYVIYTKGTVIERSSKNNQIPTGDIEVRALTLEILNTALQPPIIVADKTDALEDTRLKYRYLDLRRPVMQNYLIMKSKITSAIRDYLTNEEFLELETPILAKSTPEGARDYLVPSRLYEGEFYALPQSPQIFKQLYMVAGFEKYFQVARCFRDEDLRADRQPEFTQIDLETSFLTQDEILVIIEGLFKDVFKKILDIDLPTPFLRMTYNDAMDTYGSDKPDLRFDMKLKNVKDLFSHIEFLNNETTKAIVVKDAASITRKNIDEFTNIVKKYKASGLAWLRLANGVLTGSVVKLLTPDQQKAVIDNCGLVDGDLMLIVSSNKHVCNASLGALRVKLGNDMKLIDQNEYKFLWVTDWPIFEYNYEDGKYYVSTHPFTAPKPECCEYLETDPEKCFANAYDIVLNGYELGSGSLRIYNQDLQARMFKACGLTESEALERFGFFVEALKYGTPPHGGIGLGLDRIVMLMTKTDNIKDVTAFPKTQSARDLMMESPSRVDDKQLDDVHISIKKTN